MIEDLVRYMRRNAQPGHPGHAGPAQVVQPPAGHARELIEPALGMSEILKGFGSEQREAERPSPVCALITASDCLDKWTTCALAFFVRVLGIVHKPSSKVELVPRKAGNFLAPLSG